MKGEFAVAILLLSVLLVQLGISGLAAERAETISGVYQPVDTERAEMSHAVYQPVETEKVEESTATYPVYEIARDEYAEKRTGAYPIHRISEGEYAEISPSVAAPPEGRVEVYTNMESATFTISGPATYSGSGTFWSISNAPSGTYTITYGSVNEYIAPPSETKTLSAGGSIAFEEDYLTLESLKRAGDSIDFGEGYIVLIRNVDPEGGEVSIELQLDDRTIDDKTLKKGNEYDYEKDNEAHIYIKVVDMYHAATGDYVVLDWKVWALTALSAHFNLFVSSVPQGADILIDGKYHGKTSRKTVITELGMHSLRLVLSGYEDEERTFEFKDGEEEMLIILNRIQPTPIHTPPVTPMLVPHTHSPTPPPPTPTLVPHTYSPAPATPTPTLVPHTYSPTPSTPATEATPVPLTPTPVPGFWAITVILAILCGYWILKKRRA